MKITGSLSLVLATGLILVACAGAAGVRMSDQDHDRLMAINDNLIVPGVRVGPVFLGMTEGDLYKKLGPPTRTSYFQEGQTSYAYEPRGLLVSVGENTRVVDYIFTSSAAYATGGGLRLGSSPLQMKAELGDHRGTADWKHSFVYDGISLSFDQNGNIAGFAVSFPYATGQSVYF